jgi:hypothetical protein
VSQQAAAQAGPLVLRGDVEIVQKPVGRRLPDRGEGENGTALGLGDPDAFAIGRAGEFRQDVVPDIPVKGGFAGVQIDQRAGRAVCLPCQAEGRRGQTSASFTMPLALPKSMRPG